MLQKPGRSETGFAKKQDCRTEASAGTLQNIARTALTGLGLKERIHLQEKISSLPISWIRLFSCVVKSPGVVFPRLFRFLSGKAGSHRDRSNAVPCRRSWLSEDTAPDICACMHNQVWLPAAFSKSIGTSCGIRISSMGRTFRLEYR